MRQIKTKDAGITLIALVLTIIILLILAGITINLTIGQDGIIRRGQEAGKNYIDAVENERYELGEFTNDVENIIAKLDAKDIYGEIKVLVETEDNIETNFTGKIITLKNKNNESEVYTYTLKQNENSYSFKNLKFNNEYTITISELKNDSYVFDRPQKDIILNERSISTTLRYMYNRMYIYKEGNQCEAITGGYEPYEFVEPTSPIGYGTAIIEEDGGLTVTKLASSAGNFVYGTRDAIDLSKFKKICIDGILLKYGNNSSMGLVYNKTGNQENTDFLAQRIIFHHDATNTSNYPLNVRTTAKTELLQFTNDVYVTLSVYEDIFRTYNIYFEK